MGGEIVDETAIVARVLRFSGKRRSRMQRRMIRITGARTGASAAQKAARAGPRIETPPKRRAWRQAGAKAGLALRGLLVG
jgi:hypothetical protein